MKTFGTYVNAAVFSAAIAMVPAQASAEAEGVRTGTLACKKVGEKVSFLIHSRVPLACTFSNGNGVEEYRGESGIAMGLDLQWEPEKELVFVIVAPTPITESAAMRSKVPTLAPRARRRSGPDWV